jgi:hypothetical protein
MKRACVSCQAFACRSTPGAADADPSEQPVNRLLSPIDGLYRDQRQAQTIAERIRRAQGLGSDQPLRVGPQEAPAKGLSRLAGRWSGLLVGGPPSRVGRRLPLALLTAFVLRLARWMALRWLQAPSSFKPHKKLGLAG